LLDPIGDIDGIWAEAGIETDEDTAAAAGTAEEERRSADIGTCLIVISDVWKSSAART